MRRLFEWLVVALSVVAFGVSGCGATKARPTGSPPSVLKPEMSETSIVDPSVMTFRPVLFEGDSTLEVTPVADQSPDREVVLAGRPESGFAGVRYRLGPVLVDAASIESASADSELGQWFVDLVFRRGDPGIDRFNALAASCYEGTPACPALPGRVNGAMAIVSEGVVMSAPSINEPSFERDQIRLYGDYGEPDARSLAASVTR